METLNLIEAIKMTLTIEQGDYTHDTEFNFREMPTINEIANYTLNEVYSFLAINKMLVSSKNRPSLAKPFTFSIALECGDKSAILSDFTTKVTFGEKAQAKLIANLPMVIAELCTPKNIPVAERLKALKSFNTPIAVLN